MVVADPQAYSSIHMVSKEDVAPVLSHMATDSKTIRHGNKRNLSLSFTPTNKHQDSERKKVSGKKKKNEIHKVSQLKEVMLPKSSSLISRNIKHKALSALSFSTNSKTVFIFSLATLEMSLTLS